MRLQLASWLEVETYLKASSGIIIPIGSTEQHGPTGFVGTDALAAEGVAWKVGERIGAMVAPTISVGMAQHHLGFPGSMTLRPSTLIAVVRDTVESLARAGFDRFFFLNGHGGNIHTVNAAFNEIYAEKSLSPASNRPAVRCTMMNWFMCNGVRELALELYGDAEGSHATASEVSLTYHLFPGAAARIKDAPLMPEIAPEGKIYDADDFRRSFPDGRMGSNPKLSTAEHGARFLEIATDELAESYQAFVANR
ncbi:MAG: creatininase family protein [Rhodospirillaceae bacterium]|nr:creatininase family protein [Rhodospirillaceae bacterium]